MQDAGYFAPYPTRSERMKKTGYWAYISYSHSDERWATWLHRALESYRVPRKLVGTQTQVGKVPRRIQPVFRDRDDLSSASDLSSAVKEALAKSENLIVICSPLAAVSHWVNEEIREFGRLGKQSQIFCIIVDGDPASADAGTCCFPHRLADAGLHEPLAADVRKWADGKHLSKLKLVAGMLGLPLDQLRRRDLQKRQRTWALALVALIAVATVLISAVMFQISAQQRRNSGESLVAVKLSQLRTLLNVKEDPEDLSRLDEWDKQDLVQLIAAGGTDKRALIESAMELRDGGRTNWQAGRMEAAMVDFKQSWALIAESFRRDRDDQTVFFELGQAEYWIGEVHLNRGELDQAEDSFTFYAEITRRLIRLQPENDMWVLEMSYALTNLGRVQRARGVNNPVRSLQLMQSALEYNQLALVLDPKNTYHSAELGQSRANLADAQRDVCDLAGALQSQQENITIQLGLLEENGSNITRMNRLAFAFSGYALIQQMMGQADEAKPNLNKSLRLIEEVQAQKPADQRTFRRILARKQRIAWLNSIDGNTDQAWAALNEIAEEWQSILQVIGSDDVRTMQTYATYLLNRAWLARAKGNHELAQQLTGESMTLLASLMHKLRDNRSVGNMLMLAVFQYWETGHELPPLNIQDLLPEYSAGSGRIRACTDASMAVRKAIMLGDREYAAELTTYLLKAGYHEFDFMSVCKKYSLCEAQQ